MNLNHDQKEIPTSAGVAPAENFGKPMAFKPPFRSPEEISGEITNIQVPTLNNDGCYPTNCDL